MPSRANSSQKLRKEIASIAAKMVALGAVVDFQTAKHKAAVQLGLNPGKNLPSNQEIENALIAFQQLFQSDTQMSQLIMLRRKAIEAMKLLSQFRPMLVGSVATGTATSSSEIVLHLYFDQVEQVGLFLSGKGIPSQICEKHVRINATKTVVYPAYHFIAEQTSMLLIIFSEKDKNLSPVSSINNKAMLMLELEEVVALAESGENSAPD